MKKITTLLTLALVTSFSFGQSQRLTLLEEFTQASCGPCASQNPALNSLLNANTSKVISIKYQTSWPGVDPMNAQTQSEVGPRVTYYGVTGVPNIRYDGNVTTGAPSALTQTIINNEYAVVSPFTLAMTHTFNPNYDSIFISAVITCTQATTMTTPRFRCAMVEEVISFTTPPGSNGELVFYSVMRKMYPNATGTTIATTWTVGQTQTITFAAPIPTYIYDINQIGVVGFIQDDVNRNVKQAGYSVPQPIALNSTVTALTNIPFVTCANTFTPSATIKNLGASTMTSCTINMQLDANTPTTQAWTGSLTTGQSQVVVLPAQTISAGAHTFKVWTSDPNGTPTPITLTPSHSKTASIVNASTAIAAPIIEGMENPTFAPTGWAVSNSDNAATWARATNCSGFGNSTACTKMDFFTSPGSMIDEFLAPAVNMSTVTSAFLNFNVAYCQKTNQNDRLQVRVSTDCGVSWTVIFNKAGSTLSTRTPMTGVFTPTATQWRAESVSMASYIGQANVLVKFTATSAAGNNLYVDDINIAGPSGVIDLDNNISLNIYPNPASGNATISISLNEAQNVSVEIYNTIGEKVYSFEQGQLSADEHNITFSTSNLTNGVYFVKVKAGENMIAKKIIVNN